jgi:hypothetical protein
LCVPPATPNDGRTGGVDLSPRGSVACPAAWEPGGAAIGSAGEMRRPGIPVGADVSGRAGGAAGSPSPVLPTNRRTGVTGVSGVRGYGGRGRPVVHASELAAQALGYVRVPEGAPVGEALARSVQVVGLAVGRGWRVGELFVEDDPTRPLLAFTSLVAAARLCRPVAVLLSGPDDLGSSPASVSALRAKMEREIGVPVLVAGSAVLTLAVGPLPVRRAGEWLR